MSRANDRERKAFDRLVNKRLSLLEREPRGFSVQHGLTSDHTALPVDEAEIGVYQGEPAFMLGITPLGTTKLGSDGPR